MVSYLALLWESVLPLVWSSPNIPVVHLTRPTLGPLVLRRSLVLFFADDGEVPESYNIPHTMSELRFALAPCRDGASGPDGLSYPFLRHLHPTAMEFLLSFLNWIYTSELFPGL